MTWWSYVVRTSGTDSPKAMSQLTGIDAPSFSKWKNGQVPKAETVARFARAYDAAVLEAFVAAGFLTAEEARVRPAPAPDFNQLSNEELLGLVRGRMTTEHQGVPVVSFQSVLSAETMHAAMAHVLHDDESPQTPPTESVEEYLAARAVGRSPGLREQREEQDAAGEQPDPEGPESGA